MAKRAAGKAKIIAIIGSLAALALVLSPALSLVQIPGAKNSGVNSFPADAEFIPDNTVVENVSDKDLAACNSVNTSVRDVLGARNGTVDERSIASDKLIAEFCSRPVLIHEIMGTDYQPLTLVAYACDTSNGKIGTAALQDSLAEHKVVYCDSAKKLILNESNSFLSTVEQFRTDYLPSFGSGISDDGNFTGTEDDSNFQSGTQEQADSSFNATAVEMTLDEVTQSLHNCIAQANAGDYYPAAQSFDNASKKFIALFQDEAES